MSKFKSWAGALALAGTALATGTAGAAGIDQVQTLVIDGGSTVLGHAFDAGSANTSFTDRFNFSLSSLSTLSSVISAFTAQGPDTISITGFSIFNSGGLSLGGTQLSSGAFDAWTLGSNHLVADSYSLLVTGKVLTSAATSYGGSLVVAAVPEPETYAMLLAGVGVVGLLGRRRNTASKNKPASSVA